tara:strand:+ start:464 stop:634 length:171 start_codon:yes stop_codon:yes gene_type:complete
MTSISRNGWQHNKQIMAPAKAGWDANTQAASPLSPARPRPIFGRYVSKVNQDKKDF